MADPDLDFGIVYDEQGFIHILHSTFFDVNPRIDNTFDEYVERILDTLVEPRTTWQRSVAHCLRFSTKTSSSPPSEVPPANCKASTLRLAVLPLQQQQPAVVLLLLGTVLIVAIVAKAEDCWRCFLL
ncbi:hypothetical protein IEQ34_008315 [Dendrobium chrysotoxum]|uniref:Uncharacterized protein n=1 Tax=Dendrobium chrysotoxum TaxID=161865 RepID=A0AAV7GG10_DENCH|nr:hypothetical protein IEQ34_008315 [Dendrobium chrysotoxum]